jgi:hypothetical protein
LLLFAHRVNAVEDLVRVPCHQGVEVDVRDYDGELRLAHDPLVRGPALDEFLAHYRHAGIIFNTKCDGLEAGILRLVHRYRISDYFFLDTTLPTLVSLTRQGIRHAAVRFSEYEPLELALRFAGLVDWVWVDCFNRIPLDPAAYAKLREHFKICLVSPELQLHGRGAIQEYRRLLRTIPPDAVCTDYPDDWLMEAAA